MADRAIITTEERALSVGHSETNPAAVYLAGLQPIGRKTMQATLGKVADLVGFTIDAMPWAQLQYEHVAAIRTKLAEQYKPATVNKYLCALRGVMRAAWRLGQIDAEHYQRVADVKGVTGSTLPAGRGLSPGEVHGLMMTCVNDPTPTGARDAAIIALAYAGGLRRAAVRDGVPLLPRGGRDSRGRRTVGGACAIGAGGSDGGLFGRPCAAGLRGCASGPRGGGDRFAYSGRQPLRL